MKLVHQISSWVILLLGVGHMTATPAFYPGFTAEALWFAGTGLALVFLGLLNLTATQTPGKTGMILCLLANALASVYGVLIPMLVPEPQAFVAEVAFVAALAGSIWGRVVLK
jgi:hypothetical protein